MPQSNMDSILSVFLEQCVDSKLLEQLIFENEIPFPINNPNTRNFRMQGWSGASLENFICYSLRDLSSTDSDFGFQPNFKCEKQCFEPYRTETYRCPVRCSVLNSLKLGVRCGATETLAKKGLRRPEKPDSAWAGFEKVCPRFRPH